LELAQDFADRIESAGAPTQPGELWQCRFSAATTIEQAVNLLHDVTQRSQLW